MLRSIKSILKHPIEALDGNIGSIKDCLFDDQNWRLRYIVADTRKWLPGRKVLLSPLHVKQADIEWESGNLPVNLSTQQVKDSPELSEDAPVSDLYEEEYGRYYPQLLPYMSGEYAWGAVPSPYLLSDVPAQRALTEIEQEEHVARMRKINRSHLRSAIEVIGYDIDATDDSFGTVDDFIFDDQIWRLQYLVVDTGSWLPGEKSLIDIDWIGHIEWSNSSATVNLSREQIRNAPKYDPKVPLDPNFEHDLHEHYRLSTTAAAKH